MYKLRCHISQDIRPEIAIIVSHPYLRLVEKGADEDFGSLRGFPLATTQDLIHIPRFLIGAVSSERGSG